MDLSRHDLNLSMTIVPDPEPSPAYLALWRRLLAPIPAPPPEPPLPPAARERVADDAS